MTGTIRRNVVGDEPARLPRDARGKQPVGDGLRVHVGEVVFVEVVDQRLLEGLHQLAELAFFRFDLSAALTLRRMRARQVGQFLGKVFGGGDYLAEADL